ncbi:MAG: hypothetical protein QOH21_2747 [Acidobacteriota bacterium]|jgi:hypothetical protein|nr:hypothetical protein [Acidobacteriota bacterium]
MAGLRSETSRPPKATGIARAQVPALIIGIIGLAIAIAGYFISGPEEFFRAWLSPFVFWFFIPAGALGILCLQYVTGGEWGVLIRRPLGAAARTIPLFLLFGLPVVLGLQHIYVWANENIVAHDHLLQQKQLWLNPTGWLVRTLLYFALWSLWAWRIRRLSLKFYEDRSPYVELTRRKWAASGLLVYVFTLTFTGIDWVMSLEPKWYSSMFGIAFLVSAGLSAFAFVTLFLCLLAGNKAMEDILKPSHFRDLGNLMLAFTMLWAYTNFSQFLLIWYGNIKEETPYYLTRMHGVWGWMALALILFHFFLPFTMLLMRDIKDRPKTIMIVTIVILLMRFVDTYWLIAPAFYGEEFHFPWITIFAFLGIGGVWLFAFLAQLKGQTIIPIHETWVEEAIREGALTTEARNA